MAFDQHKNLAIASVTNAPGTAGTALNVAGGEGARFPAVPFNATVWPATELPTPVTAEVVRVTAIAADSFTIVRSQEGTTARAIVAGDLIAATITAKTITDIESGVNFPQLGTAADLLFTTPGTHLIRTSSVDGADADIVQITAAGPGGNTRAAYINLFGNESPGNGGTLTLAAGASTPGQIAFVTGAANRGLIHPSGGFSWGGTVDPGAGNLRVDGQVVVVGAGIPVNATVATTGVIYAQLANSSNTLQVGIEGAAGNFGATIGAALFHTGGSQGINVMATHAGGAIRFQTGGLATRGVMHPSGGFSWGGTTDPGDGFIVGGPYGTGNVFAWVRSGDVRIGTAGTAVASVMTYFNGNGVIGSISTSGSATAYNTTSDARLKTPLYEHRNTAVLRDTVIHKFVWKADGTEGRGVFAQEAVSVLPCAVSVGTDETDDQGRLTHPWGVDYSKYVPDLIVGWQDHDQRFGEMAARVAFLEGAITAMREPHSPAAEWFNRLRTTIRAWVSAVWPAWITP